MALSEQQLGWKPTFQREQGTEEPPASPGVSVPPGLGRPSFWRRIAMRFRNRVALVRSRIGFVIRPAQEPHGLPGPLVVSITSYPKRFKTLTFTLRSLLSQSVRPEKVVLWVGRDAIPGLPDAVRQLQSHGLEIRETDDIGPFTKIIPALQEFPDAFIVTADDDVFYPPDWLARLVKAWPGDFNRIVCHRAHRVTFAPNGVPLPYAQWRFEVSGPETSDSLFPTGVGGVLYPPGSLGAGVLDRAAFEALCPKADDLWLYFMGRMSGSTYMLIGPHRPIALWPGSQRVALYHGNVVDGGNQIQLDRLIAHFGWPSPPAPPHAG
jgi:hypothetical protein